MYIARITDRPPHYMLRESVKTDGALESRDLFDLGSTPGQWVCYPGGNAFYLDEALVYDVMDKACDFDADALEDLFWPWVRPDIRRATAVFRDRTSNRTKRKRLTRAQKEEILKTTHPFDMRRAHFLKFGNMDQGQLCNMPAVLFKGLAGKCRDEIEQEFMAREARLKERELKSYTYTVFNLQQFFQGIMAKKMPHTLDQGKVEAFFLEELCRVNSQLFHLTSRLHEYLVRYAVMFFDNTYADTVLLDELKNDFIFRHRAFRQPPPKPAVSGKQARSVFNISRQELKTLTKKELVKRYRELARKHHPDKGGSHEAFVSLNNAFQALLEKIRPSG